MAACGLVGGAELPMTVYPFILRGGFWPELTRWFTNADARQLGNVWRVIEVHWTYRHHAAHWFGLTCPPSWKTYAPVELPAAWWLTCTPANESRPVFHLDRIDEMTLLRMRHGPSRPWTGVFAASFCMSVRSGELRYGGVLLTGNDRVFSAVSISTLFAEDDEYVEPFLDALTIICQAFRFGKPLSRSSIAMRLRALHVGKCSRLPCDSSACQNWHPRRCESAFHSR